MTSSAPDWNDVAWTCPACGSALEMTNGRFEGACGHQYPVVGGIPRFVGSEEYSAPFGFEWNRHRATQVDSVSGTTRSRDTFLQKTGLTRDELADRMVLDVGVGSGRFAEIAIDQGARVVGIDLSTAVSAAHENVGDAGLVAQADLFHPPFAARSFDVVYSIGVLHHTPDTRAAVRSIAELVKPGGILAVWVYSRGRWYWAADVIRRVTTRMDTRKLYRLCVLASHLYPLYRLPVVGRPLRFLLPISMEADPNWRILDTFDWYAPRFQWKHSRAEVAGWFQELGFEDITVGDASVSVRGRRPTAPDGGAGHAAEAAS